MIMSIGHLFQGGCIQWPFDHVYVSYLILSLKKEVMAWLMLNVYSRHEIHSSRMLLA